MVSFEEFLTFETFYLIAVSIIVLLTVAIIEKILRKAIGRFCKKSGLKKHVENMLRMISRIAIYSTGITFVLGVWGLPTEWFISVSALSGAAIGFASTQTIGNFLAGLYIMVTRPFEVNEYVRIGGTEGEVRAITLNYVKIYTPTYTIIEVPNRVVLNSTIHRLMSNDLIDYSFTMSFAGKIWEASWVPSTDLFEKVLEPAIEEFWTKHKKVLPRKPEITVSNISRMDRTVTIRTFFPKGKAKILYDLQPELQKTILHRLDNFRIKKDSK